MSGHGKYIDSMKLRMLYFTEHFSPVKNPGLFFFFFIMEVVLDGSQDVFHVVLDLGLTLSAGVMVMV